MGRSILDRFNRPEYFYQPTKLLRRLIGKKSEPGAARIVELPWKLPLEVDPAETIGRIIWHHGVFELPVVEAIFRLVDPEDNFLDVGANIGYMTSAAIAAGAKTIIAFEAHPDLFARLARNRGHWIGAQAEVAGRVRIEEKAISSKCGTAALQIPKFYFSENQGLATLESREDQVSYLQVEVATTTLDRVIGDIGAAIGVLKIDIEGHELQAFAGGCESLKSGKVRDIIYEDEDPAGTDSEVSCFLRSLGYSIFVLNKTLFGLALGEKLPAEPSLEPPNLLATLDSSRARQRMATRGYRCLNKFPGSRIQSH